MEPNAAPSRVEDFVLTRVVELPVPGLGGPLRVRVCAIPFEDLLKVLKRLPGSLQEKADRPDPPEITDEALAGGFTNLYEKMTGLADEVEHDLELVRPIIERVVDLGTVEPRPSFGPAPEPGCVPWRSVNVRNQVAWFKAILEVSGFTGGPAETYGKFPDGGQGGSGSGVGNDGASAGERPEAVQGADVPSDQGPPSAGTVGA